MVSPWVGHVIWWQVYPLGFLGAEKELGAVTGRGKPAAEAAGVARSPDFLGRQRFAARPIFTSTSHGYDTVDYFQIDPRLGDDDDFDALVAACRERGVRLLLDGVFNHVGRDFPPVAKALAEGPGSAAEDWVSHLYDTGGVITADYFEGHDNLITLNHSSTRVQEYVRDVMLHWLRRGIDGWRLDAAYAVPAQFWAAVLPAVREEFPDAWFVGEMIHGNYIDYVETSGLDSVTQYELWWAIWSSIDKINFHELQWTLGRHAKFVRTLRPADLSRQPRRDPGGQPDQRSAALVARGGATRLPARGTVRLLRRRVRPGGGQGEPPERRRRSSARDAEGAVVCSPTHTPELEQVYRRMIGLRRRNAWLVDAVIETQEVEDASIVIRARARHGKQSLTLALNLTGEPLALTNQRGGAGGRACRRGRSRCSARLGRDSGLRPARARRSNN